MIKDVANLPFFLETSPLFLIFNPYNSFLMYQAHHTPHNIGDKGVSRTTSPTLTATLCAVGLHILGLITIFAVNT